MNTAGSSRGRVRIECPVCLELCQVNDRDDSCVFFHECECCGERLRPVAQDCCVICSYGVDVDGCAIVRS